MLLDLARQGLTVSAIARRTGRDRMTIRTYIERGLEPPAYRRRQPTPSPLVPFAAFLREHPAIGISTRLGNTAGLLEALTACEIEVAVMALIDPVEGMACTKLADQRLVACMPRGVATRRISLERLAEGPLVLREPGSMTCLMLERALATKGLVARVQLEVGSRDAAREAIAAGIGVGVVHDGEQGEDGRIVAVPMHAPPIDRGAYAVKLPESLDLPAMGAFIRAGRGGS